VVGVELDSGSADVLREKVEGAAYDWKAQEVTIRVEEDPVVRLKVIARLADCLSEVRMDMLPNS
jgi:hypothetical protein